MSENRAPESPPTFIPGLDLCARFYNEAIQPILENDFAHLKYSAALLGSGSEVLGFDNEMSSDHHWGPRAILFLEKNDFAIYAAAIRETLATKLPRRFAGYPTGFSSPALNDKGVQQLDFSNEGPINHRVECWTLEQFFFDYLNFDINNEITPCDWLSFPQQLLSAVTAGRVFHDQVGLQNARDRFAYYPQDVWLYLLACSWARIEQEEHLMGRAGFVGDELGSAIIGSRLVREIMRLCFLMARKYAPYPKWFGTAFMKLEWGPPLAPVLQQALSASDWQEREKYLSQAYEVTAGIHNSLSITEPLPEKVSRFFDRPFMVMSKGVFSAAIKEKISDPSVRQLAQKNLIGSCDQFSDSTDLLADASWRLQLKGIYLAP